MRMRGGRVSGLALGKHMQAHHTRALSASTTMKHSERPEETRRGYPGEVQMINHRTLKITETPQRGVKLKTNVTHAWLSWRLHWRCPRLCAPPISMSTSSLMAPLPVLDPMRLGRCLSLCNEHGEKLLFCGAEAFGPSQVGS